MEVDLKRHIAAVITPDPTLVRGSAPTFIVDSEEQRDHFVATLTNILRGAPHDLGNGVIIIVKH